jgi:hypothetical protein
MSFLHWRLLPLNIFLELFLLMDELPLLCMRTLRLRGAPTEWTLNHTLRDRTCHQLGVFLLIWPTIRDWKLGQTAVHFSLLKGEYQLGIVPRPPDDLGLCQQRVVFQSSGGQAPATCWFLTLLIFDPQAGNMFLRNYGSHANYTAQYPRRWQHSER